MIWPSRTHPPTKQLCHPISITSVLYNVPMAVGQMMVMA